MLDLLEMRDGKFTVLYFKGRLTVTTTDVMINDIYEKKGEIRDE